MACVRKVLLLALAFVIALASDRHRAIVLLQHHVEKLKGSNITVANDAWSNVEANLAILSKQLREDQEVGSAKLQQFRRECEQHLLERRSANHELEVSNTRVAHSIQELVEHNKALRNEAEAIAEKSDRVVDSIRKLWVNLTSAGVFAAQALNYSDVKLGHASELEVLETLNAQDAEREKKLQKLWQVREINATKTLTAMFQTTARIDPQDMLAKVVTSVDKFSKEQKDAEFEITNAFNMGMKTLDEHHSVLLAESANLNASLNSELELQENLTEAIAFLQRTHDTLENKSRALVLFVKEVGAFDFARTPHGNDMPEQGMTAAEHVQSSFWAKIYSGFEDILFGVGRKHRGEEGADVETPVLLELGAHAFQHKAATRELALLELDLPLMDSSTMDALQSVQVLVDNSVITAFEQAKIAFQRADVDHDGVLSRGEALSAGIRTASFDQMCRDGTVTIREFANAVALEAMKKQNMQRALQQWPSKQTEGCAADYGARLGDPLCCDQKGFVGVEFRICPAGRPVCRGFARESRWGTCQARMVASNAVPHDQNVLKNATQNAHEQGKQTHDDAQPIAVGSRNAPAPKQTGVPKQKAAQKNELTPPFSGGVSAQPDARKENAARKPSEHIVVPMPKRVGVPKQKASPKQKANPKSKASPKQKATPKKKAAPPKKNGVPERTVPRTNSTMEQNGSVVNPISSVATKIGAPLQNATPNETATLGGKSSTPEEIDVTPIAKKSALTKQNAEKQFRSAQNTTTPQLELSEHLAPEMNTSTLGEQERGSTSEENSTQQDAVAQNQSKAPKVDQAAAPTQQAHNSSLEQNVSQQASPTLRTLEEFWRLAPEMRQTLSPTIDWNQAAAVHITGKKEKADAVHIADEKEEADAVHIAEKEDEADKKEEANDVPTADEKEEVDAVRIADEKEEADAVNVADEKEKALRERHRKIEDRFANEQRSFKSLIMHGHVGAALSRMKHAFR